MEERFWHDRPVFVTGHTGFIGGWLSFWLARLGARVTGYALAPPTEPSFFDCVGLTRDIVSIQADVRDLDRLKAALRQAAPEFVFHLAAQPLVRAAHAAPVETFAVNLMGTVNLLEAMRECETLRGAVIVTTDKVYENRERERGYVEDDRLGGHEAYGASKAAAELAVDAFRAYFPRAGLATVRAGNVIGGGDWAADRLVPDAIRAFANDETLVLRRPDAVRPWQHVLDPVRGMLMLAERLAEAPECWSGPWNFGPDERDARSVLSLAAELAQLWGRASLHALARADGPPEARLLALSSEKAMARLGWWPRWSLSRALAETVAWYKAQIAREPMRAATERQILAYAGANRC